MSEARWLKNKQDLEIAKKILMVKEADKMLRRMHRKNEELHDCMRSVKEE